MSNFRFDNKSRGRRDSKRPELYDAVCDECGKNCKVPFKPSAGKPVYCSDCFEKKGGRDSGRSSRGSSSRGLGVSESSIFKLTENIKILNTKLDKIIELLSLTGKGKEDLKKKEV